jgi:hypothetical protein
MPRLDTVRAEQIGAVLFFDNFLARLPNRPRQDEVGHAALRDRFMQQSLVSAVGQNRLRSGSSNWSAKT